MYGEKKIISRITITINTLCTYSQYNQHNVINNSQQRVESNSIGTVTITETESDHTKCILLFSFWSEFGALFISNVFRSVFIHLRVCGIWISFSRSMTFWFIDPFNKNIWLEPKFSRNFPLYAMLWVIKSNCYCTESHRRCMNLALALCKIRSKWIFILRDLCVAFRTDPPIFTQFTHYFRNDFHSNSFSCWSILSTEQGKNAIVQNEIEIKHEEQFKVNIL